MSREIVGSSLDYSLNPTTEAQFTSLWIVLENEISKVNTLMHQTEIIYRVSTASSDVNIISAITSKI